jgi:hypothetical protein
MNGPSSTKLWKGGHCSTIFGRGGTRIATGGNFFLRKWVGSGMMKLACKVSPLRDSGLVPRALARVVNVTVAPFHLVHCQRPSTGVRIASLILPGFERAWHRQAGISLFHSDELLAVANSNRFNIGTANATILYVANPAEASVCTD